VNPDADSGGTAQGEARRACWTVSYLRGLEAGMETRELGPGRPNAIAALDTVKRATKAALFAPHIRERSESNLHDATAGAAAKS